MIKIPIFKKNDIEINYITEGKGKPIIFIPGSNTKWQAWNYQIPFFRDKMNVISLDLRGSGKSSRPNYPYTIDMFVEDLNNLIEHLNINQKTHLCGSSLGGFIALSYALKYPETVESLILCGTAAQADQTGMNQRFKMYEDFVKMDQEQRVKTILPNLFSRQFRRKLKKDKELYDQIRNDMNFITYYNDAPRYEDYINQLSALRGYDIRDSLKNILHPVLIMIGTKDLIVPLNDSEEMHELLPHSPMEKFNDVGHGFTIELAEAVNNKI